MSAWSSLLAASSLLGGTAWALITNPKTGGSGTGVVINDGYTISMPGAIELEMRDQAIAAFVQDDPIQLGLVPPTITEIA